MARTIDPIKKERVKQGLLKGKSASQAMKDAGYSEATAEHNVSSKNTLLNTVTEQIIKELKAKDVTVELVIGHLNEDRELARAKGDIATMKACDELLGKYLAMFTERKIIDASIITNEDQTIIEQYMPKATTSSINRINNV